MNAKEELKDQKAIGLYQKYNVSRTDGDPTGKHADDEYFVLDLTTDKHTIPALVAYAESCAEEYPALASDLRAKIAKTVTAANEFITVPEITLPRSGIVVPSFNVGKYMTSEVIGGFPIINAESAPWVEVDFYESKKAAARASYGVLTATQSLALDWDISQQDINWTGGKVGKGEVFRGLHKGTVSSRQAGNYESTDPEERCWHQLSNGERIYHHVGNVYSWLVDDIHGDENGLTGKIPEDSILLTTAPYPSMEKGMGWRPDGACDWSGRALIRGGFWSSGSRAGVFYLIFDWPDYRYGDVGFRCTEEVSGPAG